MVRRRWERRKHQSETRLPAELQEKVDRLIAKESKKPPPELECLEGACGPYIPTDKPEFSHAGEEAIEWFLRMDAKDVEEQKYAAKLGRWVRTALTLLWWAGWAFTSGLTLTLAAGENLLKLPKMISDVISIFTGLGR